MGRRGLRQNIADDVNTDNQEAENVYKKISVKAEGPDQVKFAVTYDFKNSQEKQAGMSKFHRNLKKLMIESGNRRTQSELIFDYLETALRVKVLSQECGAYTHLSAVI